MNIEQAVQCLKRLNESFIEEQRRHEATGRRSSADYFRGCATGVEQAARLIEMYVLGNDPDSNDN